MSSHSIGLWPHLTQKANHPSVGSNAGSSRTALASKTLNAQTGMLSAKKEPFTPPDFDCTCFAVGPKPRAFVQGYMQ